MSKEEFNDTFRTIIMGLVVDAYTKDRCDATQKFKELEKAARYVTRLVDTMYDKAIEPKTPGKEVKKP